MTLPSYKRGSMQPTGVYNSSFALMNARLGNTDLPHYHYSTVDGANEIAKGLQVRGGFPQQERMIRDKRKTLDKATLYSYQACLIKKVQDKDFLMEEVKQALPVRALINPDKNKMDYDDKILSVGFEHGFKPGDVFEWYRTHTYWLITLQDVDEIAYFRGEIRRCDYQINWLDDEGNELKTFAAIRGPVETKINFIQKHQISIDEPNYSLHILMPRNEQTMKQFVRYAKFYLKDADNPDDTICWRVEATDSISTRGILEITAVEYYANETEDDVDKGLVGAYIERNVEPEIDPKLDIVGPTFIKPKIEYSYYVEADVPGDWYIDGPKVPVKFVKFKTERGTPGVKITWNSSYSGQFTIWYGQKDIGHDKNFTKTIVVESLF